MKINIRESLNRLDLQTNNKYDLRNTYDCSKISDDKKKKLAEALNKNASAKEVSKLLSEDYDDFDPKYDARYEVRSYYDDRYFSLEDNIYTDDFEEVKDWVWEKCQKGLYINVVDRENGNEVNINTENYDFESDDAYRVFDDLDELSPLSEQLKEDIEDEYDFEETDFDDGEVEYGNTFIEDGREWTWIERIAGPIHLDFDNWAVWSARDYDYIQEKIKPYITDRGNLTIDILTKIYDEAEIAYFVVDEDTGFIDWGPVETSTEAQDFLNGKVEDYENDEEYGEIEIEEESLNESKTIEDTGYSVILHYDDIGNKRNSEYDYEVNKDDFIDGMFDIVYEDEDAPENYDQCLEWIMDNFETLVNKYKNKILDYFFDDAQEDFFNK